MQSTREVAQQYPWLNDYADQGIDTVRMLQIKSRQPNCGGANPYEDIIRKVNSICFYKDDDLLHPNKDCLEDATAQLLTRDGAHMGGCQGNSCASNNFWQLWYFKGGKIFTAHNPEGYEMIHWVVCKIHNASVHQYLLVYEVIWE